ncbi:MAG: EutN/CcmL family microcompartment protein [Deltaproteobacteria bacterium]|nr:EutN/CcmL family microcompartment protein [Deltaproteobacteria bacterium]
MILGRVTGTVVSTAKMDQYLGTKLLIVEALDERRESSGRELLAVDNAQAGEGDLVLVLTEGNGVRQILGYTDRQLPILELIVGIVDEVEVP